ncbi:hypothetical protein ACFY05_32275 [Microtetraspora fusca]|uniref:HK97 family phage prohead protease n=1 Tax=Microtetraspora fusca TaxID=1997 RepID=A0ABW6VDX3_MICFU
MRLEFKATTTSSTEAELLTADDETGVVEAIVSVTGVVDDDGDILEPGVYAETLKRRKPKGIFGHDWAKWASRTEAIEEWLPGDPRLPAKTRDGKPWPQGAGALYVKTRYNLATDVGRNAYHDVKFFSEVAECEWSIGFRVPKGKSVRGKDGIRRIKGIDLFEYSPVLFGANSMSGTLAVKSALGGREVDGDEEEYEPIGGEADAPEPQDGDQEPEQDAGDEADQGAAQEDGEEDSEESALHSAAIDDLDPAELEEGLRHAPEDQGAGEDDLADKSGVPGVADTPEDERSVARLKRWYLTGEGAAKIRWNTPGDWERCVRIAGKHMPPERAKGFCANLHHAATGQWPGPNAHGGRKDNAAQETVESTSFPHLPGTFEELKEHVRDAAAARLGGEALVEVVGTWPDRAVITAWTSEDGQPRAKSYEVPYVVDLDPQTGEGAVRVDELVPVNLTVSVDGASESGEMLLPYPGMLEDVTSGLKALLAGEHKAGRVLSGANEKRLVAAVKEIVAVLRRSGYVLDLSPAAEDNEQEPTPETLVDSTAPSAQPGGTTGKSAAGMVEVDPALQARAYRIMADASSRRLV